MVFIFHNTHILMVGVKMKTILLISWSRNKSVTSQFLDSLPLLCHNMSPFLILPISYTHTYVYIHIYLAYLMNTPPFRSTPGDIIRFVCLLNDFP